MEYSFTYPGRVQRISGRRGGRITICEEHIEQTHDELLLRVDNPSKSIRVRALLDAPLEQVWEVAAGSASRFFSHDRHFAGVTPVNRLGSSEGGRYIIHRMSNGSVIDRMGEVLVNLHLAELSVSDIDPADASICGPFPSLYTARFERHTPDPRWTIIVLIHTVLGVAPPQALGTLANLADSIRKRAELSR